MEQELGVPPLGGPLDFVYPAYPVATPLMMMMMMMMTMMTMLCLSCQQGAVAG